MALSILQNTKGSLDLIVYLYGHEKSTTTTLIECTAACQETVYKALERLLSLGIIHREQEGVFPRRIYYSLTEKGKRMAESPVLEWDRMMKV